MLNIFAALALAGAVFMTCASAYAGTIDPKAAQAAFAERQAFCDRDGGKLWGKAICGPLFFVDPDTRDIVANRNTPDNALAKNGDVFTGKLDKSVLISSTTTEWKGLRWSMILWPLPDDAAMRKTELVHEAWHVIQESLGFPTRSPVEAALGTPFGRTTMRMEWRALAAALDAPDVAARKAAVRDALIFRAWRRARVKDAAEDENELLLNEGLAEYTGRRLTGQSDADVAKALGGMEDNNAYARLFAFVSGPAYGFLLDDFSKTWRKHVNAQSDLGDMLARAADVSLPANVESAAQQAGQRYDLARVQKDEANRAHAHDEKAKAYTAALVNGPLLHLPGHHMNTEFNPSLLFPLPPYGTVYPTLHAVGEWGTLTVTDGALLDDAFTVVTVAAPANAQSLSGKGWTLDLKPGWSIVPDGKPGDFTVAKKN
ncbi:MAG: hypothetical protein JSR55_04630 [Proteobacteria bacterium]|nr:hypothetical protein [Pseudomonadota bacterium]